MPSALTKAEIVDALRARIGLPRHLIAPVVEDLLEEIKSALERGEPVLISGFGRFEIQDKAARVGRNPQTGEITTIPARRVVRFKAGKNIHPPPDPIP